MISIIKTNYFRKKVFFQLFVLVITGSVLNSHAQNFPAGFSQQMVANGFVKPSVFAFAPDGRLFVAQQTGAVRVVKNGSLLVRPFVKITVNATGERGLQGIAFDPAFNTNHYIYVYYTLPSKVNNRISRFTASGDTVVPGSETVVLDLDSVHSVNDNGGILQFGLDGKLYVSVGENSNPPNAQNLDTYLGKILRINSDGSVPTGNPFTTGSAQRRRVWAYGVRNPYTIAVQPVTGRIFMNDVGTSNWEEINDCTTGGNNYGMPYAEGMSTNPNYTNPIYAYAHGSVVGQGCAVTGGTFFSPTSTSYPNSYKGKYFFLDYCGGWIDMLTLSGTTAVRSNFASGLGSLMIGMATGPDGNLYYLSRTTNAIYKIVYGNAPVTTRLNPIADAYVRGATANANTNYGNATTLLSQVNAAAGSNYETFLKFNLASFSGAVSSAILRVYGALSSTAVPSLNVEAHNCANNSWRDTTITWNNKPIADAAVLATTTISGKVKEYYEWDITSQVIALKNAGATSITIKLNNTTASATRETFNSKEATTYKPELVIVHLPMRLMDTTTPDATVSPDFDIYPNPAGNFFNITLRNMEDANLEIYDLKGELVMKTIIEKSSYERINTEALKSGLYLVRLSNGNNVMSKKLFLNK